MLGLNLSEALDTGDQRAGQRCRKQRRRPPSNEAEIRRALEALGDNVALAADYFGVERSTIYRVLQPDS